jgi:hypothetical protein
VSLDAVVMLLISDQHSLMSLLYILTDSKSTSHPSVVIIFLLSNKIIFSQTTLLSTLWDYDICLFVVTKINFVVYILCSLVCIERIKQ